MRKPLTLVAAATLVAGGVAFGIGGGVASAHHSNETIAASCYDADGNYDVAVTIDIPDESWVDDTLVSTVTVNTPGFSTPDDTITGPGTVVVSGQWSIYNARGVVSGFTSFDRTGVGVDSWSLPIPSPTEQCEVPVVERSLALTHSLDCSNSASVTFTSTEDETGELFLNINGTINGNAAVGTGTVGLISAGGTWTNTSPIDWDVDADLWFTLVIDGEIVATSNTVHVTVDCAPDDTTPPDTDPPVTEPPVDPPTYELDVVCTSVNPETGQGSVRIVNSTNQGITVNGTPIASGDEATIEATGDVTLTVVYADGEVGIINVGECGFIPPTPTTPPSTVPATSPPASPPTVTVPAGPAAPPAGPTPTAAAPAPQSASGEEWTLPETL